MDWKQPEKIATIEGSDYGKPASVSEIVRASVQLPTQGPERYSASVKTPRQQFKPKVARSVAAPKPRTSAFVEMSKPTKMDSLVDRFDMRVKQMIKAPNKYTRNAFYQTCQDIIATGNPLPTASAICMRHGITSELILRGLVKRGYMVAHQGPSRLQVRARRAVDWFRAKSSVPAAFTRRAKHGQLQGCREVVCPDAGPNDECEECDQLEEMSQLRSMASGAVVIKSNTGGVRARLDGNPVRFNSLGQRTR